MTKPPHPVELHTPEPTPGVRSSAARILRRTADIVDGPRGTTHGDKETSFAAIARLWSAYLQSRRAPSWDLTSVDVAHMMVLMKMMRAEWGTATEDHWVDMAGYSGIAGELALEDKEPTGS